MKKALILYDTVYGNTKRVAMSLCRGLEAGGLYVDSSPIKDFNIIEIKNYDIIGIGSPTHFHGASKNMKAFLNRIKSLKMEDKFGFIFETKINFRLAGSAAKQITKYLKKMKIKIIHPSITGIVLDKEGPLQETTADLMEQVGLNISEKVNNSYGHKEIYEGFKYLKLPIMKFYLNRFKWIVLGGGPIFFFIRAIHLASTGGDCFGTINPIFSWFLLSLEITLSGIVGSISIAVLIKWKLEINKLETLKKLNLKKFVLYFATLVFIIHFIRVAIWFIVCVL